MPVRGIHTGSLLTSAFWIAALAIAAEAGTICGTVKDGDTGAPVAQAGVFLREADGPYTGLNTATDASGAFCISAIPPGLYDVEVRVDDYQVAYLHNVPVETTTDVDLLARFVPALSSPWPNPARDHVRFAFTLPRPAAARIELVDAQGRFIIGWGGGQLSAGAHSIPWDLRDPSGRAISAGRYYVRLTAEGVRAVRSFSRVH